MNWVDAILPEADNLAAAVSFALARRAAVALVRLLGGGGQMWAHAGRMRQLADWWDGTLPHLPSVPNAEFPPNRLTLALGSAGSVMVNTGRYEQADELLQRALTVEGASANALAFARGMNALLAGCRGDDPSSVVGALEVLINDATERGLAVESPARSHLAIWLVLTGRAAEVPTILEPVLTGGDDQADAWIPTASAALGVPHVLEGRVDEGIDTLRDVCQEAETRTTYWRYVVYWLEALGHLLAGDGPAQTAASGPRPARSQGLLHVLEHLLGRRDRRPVLRATGRTASRRPGSRRAGRDLAGHGGQPPSRPPRHHPPPHPPGSQQTPAAGRAERPTPQTRPDTVEHLRRYLGPRREPADGPAGRPSSSRPAASCQRSHSSTAGRNPTPMCASSRQLVQTVTAGRGARVHPSSHAQ